MSVHLAGISKSYEQNSIFENVSLSVNDGEFLCFLGPSGCGKTTLLRIIAGFERVNAGKLMHKDTNITDLPPGERNFSMVFQGYTLFPHMSVIKNIAYGLECRKFPKEQIRQRCEEMLDLVHLSGMGDRFPSQLSGGQQQRVAIARALAVKPDVLLMDEAFSALDAKVRFELRSELRRMQKSLGVTTIMVTRDQEEAMELADRIVVINQGRIEQISTPSELYFSPTSAFVADFVGDMNYLRVNKGVGNGLMLAGQSLEMVSTPATNMSILAMRPEDIDIVSNSETGENLFKVVVKEVTFLGAFTTIVVTLNDGQLVLLKPSSRRRLSIHIGDTITIRLSPEFAQVMPSAQ